MVGADDNLKNINGKQFKIKIPPNSLSAGV